MEPTQQQPIATWNAARDVWETDQTSLLCEHLAVFSGTFPSSGMTRAGTAYALPTSGRRTDEDGSSLLPTPEASLSGSTPEQHLARKPGRTKVTSLNIVVEHLL